MKVTDIKQQVKRPDRYSVYVDGKYCCAFSEAGLLKSGLRVGQELSEQELNSIKDEAVLDKAKTRVFELIARRPRSQWEIEDYLKRKGYEPEIIQEILDVLSKLGYIDDLDFAKRWIANRRLLKSTSRRRLVQELRQKRVSDEIIEQALETDETDEREVLKELIARKRKQAKYQDDLKLMQYLARQGYNYDDIKSSLQDE